MYLMNKKRETLLKGLASIYNEGTSITEKDIVYYLEGVDKNINLVKNQSEFYKNKKKYEEKNIMFNVGFSFFTIDILEYNKLDSNQEYEVHISLDKDKINDASFKIVNYLRDNGICSEYQIRNYYAKDIIIVKLANKKDTELLIKYINDNLSNEIEDNPNPFMPSFEKVNISISGDLTYNEVLAKLIHRYMSERKVNNKLDDVSVSDFCSFINDEIDLVTTKGKNYSYFLYGLISKGRYDDFVLISKIIKDTLSSNLNVDNLEEYQKEKTSRDYNCYSFEEIKNIYIRSLMEIIMLLMEDYDSIDYLHADMMEYLNNNNSKVFSEKYNIRDVIRKYYDSEEFEKYLMLLGEKNLKTAIRETKYKYRYDNEQIRIILEEIENNGELSSITNYNNTRSKLGLILPKELLKILAEKLLNEKYRSKGEDTAVYHR